MKSPKFDALWGKLSDGLAAGFVGVLAFTPFGIVGAGVGAVASGVITTLMSGLKDTCRESIELAIYKVDITMTYGFICDLIDPTTCITEQEVTEEEIEDRKKRGLITSFGTGIIPSVVDLVTNK